MEIIRIPRIVQDTCRKHVLKGRSIGFVPTMGALHEGHLSLIRRARAENDVVVASIFVNPLQFGPSEDLSSYPRPIDDDIAKLRTEEIDLLFLPDPALMYPPGFATSVHLDRLAGRLCGAVRPGHFTGVATVVAKLFNITSPTRAYFGQKDFQQTVVLRQMEKDLHFGIEIVVCPIIREPDGLAMSSRNAYLDAEERKAATVLFRSLSRAAEAVASGERQGDRVRDVMRSVLGSEPRIRQIDYASAYHPETLDELETIGSEALLAIAVRLGPARLIDNMLVRTH